MAQPSISKDGKHITLGLAEVFIGGVDVGFIERAAISIEWDEVTPEYGVPLNQETTIRIRERATCQIQMAQLNVSKMLLALPGATSTTGGDLHRFDEHLTMTGVVAQPLDISGPPTQVGGPGFPLVSARVFSIDRLVEFVIVTDFTLNLVDATVTRVAGGAIADGQEVVVDYVYTDPAASLLHIGGDTCNPATFTDFVLHHERAQDCVPVELQFFKCAASSPFNMTFEKENIIIPEVTYRAYADRTKPRGRRLLKWTEGSEPVLDI